MARPSFRTSALTARLLCSAAVLFLPGMAHANPAGAQVVAGSAAVAQPSSAATTITQQSEKAIIDWQSFSIGQGETTAFRQPDAKAITLNRVTGGDPSAILGNLTANGQVWLINPNGIAFGKSARVDVAGLLATTIDIANKDFMSGSYRFQSARDPNAMVTNAGQITIHDAGLAALVAPGVANSGVIEADLGQVQLSSASAFTVDLYGDGLFNITLDKQVTQAIRKSDGTAAATAVENSGKLIADGGKVLLTANAAKSVVDHAIDMTGYVQATSASVAQNGDIVLDGGSEGTVAVAGTLDASGEGQGQKGGTADVTGENVQLTSTANVNVSGDAGGGTAHIGGDEHGTGPLPNASTTSIATGATIRADATNGNGGSVVVWSDDKTDFQGGISAKGGTDSGDGGSAEISSHGLLNFAGTADLRAASGITGSLLLDPENVTIQASGADTVTPTDPSGTSYSGNVDNSIITTATLQNALALADVTVSTGSGGSQAGDITVASKLSWGSDHSLTLSANRNITINDSVVIANTGAGDLALRADNTGTDVGTVIFNGVARVDYGGSTGTVSIFYNPADNPAGSVVNVTSYAAPTDFSSYVLTNSTVTNQFIPYMLVNSIYDLQNIRNNYSADYALGRDIDASAIANFSPIANFNGILDGLGRTISGLTISDSVDSQIGLFGQIGSYGVVRSLTLLSPSVTNSVPVGANWSLGDLAGVNNGLIENVIAENADDGLVGSNYGIITETQNLNFMYASDVSNAYIGGIAGYNHGTISNSVATGSIEVSGDTNHVGGLVGGNEALTQDSHADVSITANGSNDDVGGLAGSTGNLVGTISNSYATGDIIGTGSGSNVGGLVGYVYGKVEASHATGSVTGGDSSAIGGLAGTIDFNADGIVSSYATGNVAGGENGWIGGLVGKSAAPVTKSFATGSVTGEDNSIVGGLIGENPCVCGFGEQIITSDSYALGPVTGGANSVVGGLVGWNDGGTVSGSYATGTVSAGSQSYLGGVAGRNEDATEVIYGRIVTSYWDTETSGISVGIGSVYGDLTGTTGLTTAAFKQALPTGFDPSVWGISPGINSGYPYLLANPPVGSPTQPPVTPGSITWSVADVTSTYGTLATLGAATLNGIGVADQGDVFGTVGLFADASLSDPVSLSTGLHAGTYYEAVTSLTGSAAGNYTLSDTGNVLGQLTVDPKMLTWVVADAHSTYGTQAILGSATLTGVLSGDTGNVQPVVGISKNGAPVTLIATTSAGTYDETLTGLSGTAAGNYALAASGNTDGTLTINPKTLTWSVADATASYGTTPVPGAITLYGVVIPDDVRAEVGVFNEAALEPLSNTIPLGSYSEKVTDLIGNAADNYVLATTGNITGILTVSLSAGNVADVSHLQSLTSNPTSSVNGNPTPIGSIPASSSFRPMAIDILNSAGVDYLTNSALTDMLTNLLMQLPWQYLAQNSIEEKLVAKLQMDTDLRQSIGGGDVSNEAAGLLAGVLIGVVHDYLAESGMSPVIVEEGTLLATAGVNYSLAEQQFHDPRLAGAYAVTETTLGEIIETTETFYSWEAETDQRIIQSKQMEAYAEQLHAEAESIKGQPGMDEQYQSLMKASVSESQAAAFLAQNASGYGNGNILSAFWNSLW